jgi:hypothetical protein
MVLQGVETVYMIFPRLELHLCQMHPLGRAVAATEPHTDILLTHQTIGNIVVIGHEMNSHTLCDAPRPVH